MVLCGENFKKSDEYDSERTRPERFKKLFTKVQQRLDAVAKRDVKTYNLGRRSEKFWPNQPVWRKNFVYSYAAEFYTAKLAPKNVGPLYMKERILPWIYELSDSEANFKGIWSAKDLKSEGDADEDLPR
ncbi:hypothetical protein JTB14_023920 [Gonioctena quinquepunctata]|nr:hypothetical protein JTB14_023920 [Gonioctena quinquepunctata]